MKPFSTRWKPRSDRDARLWTAGGNHDLRLPLETVLSRPGVVLRGSPRSRDGNRLDRAGGDSASGEDEAEPRRPFSVGPPAAAGRSRALCRGHAMHTELLAIREGSDRGACNSG